MIAPFRSRIPCESQPMYNAIPQGGSYQGVHLIEGGTLRSGKITNHSVLKQLKNNTNLLCICQDVSNLHWFPFCTPRTSSCIRCCMFCHQCHTQEHILLYISCYRSIHLHQSSDSSRTFHNDGKVDHMLNHLQRNKHKICLIIGNLLLRVVATPSGVK